MHAARRHRDPLWTIPGCTAHRSLWEGSLFETCGASCWCWWSPSPNSSTHPPTHHYQLFPLMWLMFPPALCCLFSRTDGGGKRGMLYKPVQSCNAKKQQNYKMSFIINQESCTTLQNLEDDKGRLGGGGEGGGKERGKKEGCWCWQKVAQQKNGGRNATQPGVNHNYNNVAFAFQKLGDHTV